MNDSDRTGDFTKPLDYSEAPTRSKMNLIQALIHRQINQYKDLVPYEFQRAAEDKLVEKQMLEEMSCSLPDSPRSTFLMVFSPDGKKVASTHGNHNVYVTDVATGKNIQTLSGHPRTPWCIAFHPSSNQILATGCLGGQVRVWDLSGGSEVWTAEGQTVIASLAFHPVDRMLVIATYNELHFWDWSQPQPFAKCSTKTDREKVRYVTFDRLGHKLITGIANHVSLQTQWDRIHSHVPTTTTANNPSAPSGTSGTPPASVVAPTSERERSIAFCYRNLMNQYNQLVRRYFDLSRARLTPTIDRGTDPMDVMDLQNVPSTSASGSSTTEPTNPTSASASITFEPDAESTSSGSGSEASTPSATIPTSLPSYIPSESTYSWSRDVMSPRESPRNTTDAERSGPREAFHSESQSSEDIELEQANRSDSPRAVVSRADPDHPRPVPTFQLRPRLLQDPSYQLRFLTNRETFGNLSSAPTGSRRILLRPGGQFVLSRHSNSPFQPRVPLRVEGPSVTQPPSNPPTIPSQASSFSPASRLLYDHVRAFLCDRIRSATEPSSADTTTNYSRLVREPDADTGPDISWDSDSETLIIRPRSSQPPDQEASGTVPDVIGSNMASFTPSASTSTNFVTSASSASDTAPSVRRRIQVLNSRIETMQRLVRARIEVLRMYDQPALWRELCDDIRSMTHTSDSEPGPSSVLSSDETPIDITGSATDDGSFERHLRGQVRRLRAVVHELRGGIEGAVRGRDVSSMLQSASLNDVSTREVPPLPPSPSHSSAAYIASLSPECLKLATALVGDIMQCPANQHQGPGPSSAATPGPPIDEAAQQRLVNRLEAVLLRVALRRMNVEQLAEEREPQPGPSSAAPDTPLPSSVHLRALYARLRRLSARLYQPTVPPDGAEATLRADGFHRENLVGSRASASRLSSTEDRRYHRNKMQGGLAGFREREVLRARVRRTIRAILRVRSRAQQGDQELFGPQLPNPTSDAIDPTTSTGGEGSRRSRQIDSPSRSEQQQQQQHRSGSRPERCMSCGLSKSSSMKRKGANPQKLQVKFSRCDNGERRASADGASAMLQNMIYQMQSIVQMQRESQPPGNALNMTAAEQELVREINEEIRLMGLPLSLNFSRAQHLRNFWRNVAQLRAHGLLNNMVQSVSFFFETNPTQVVDREITKLYSLLQLALELTDLLLEQLQTSRSLNSPEKSQAVATEEPSTSGSSAEATSVPLPASHLIASSSNDPRERNLYWRPAGSIGSVGSSGYSRQFPSRLSGSSGASTSRASASVPSSSRVAQSDPIGYDGSDNSRQSISNDTPYFASLLNYSSRTEDSVQSENDGGRPSTSDHAYYRSDARSPGRAFDRVMDGHRRRARVPPYSQDTSAEQGRASGNFRYRRPRLWSVARMSTGGHIIGCFRRQRNVRFNSLVHTFVYCPTPRDRDPSARPNAASPNPDPVRNPPRTPVSRVWPDATPAETSFNVPLVRVNDVPVSDPSALNTPRARAPPVPGPEEMRRWRYPRFLHPRYFGPNPFDEQDGDNADQSLTFYRMLNANSVDPIMIAESPLIPHHRIQAWDFSRHVIPDISDRELNGVVAECKIHNDASVDVSSDGRLLVTLLPSGRLSVTTMLGVYSLDWSTLGQVLYKTGFEQNAVSVSLSPTARHLLVGLASRPMALRERDGDRNNMAQIFRLGGARARAPGSWRNGRGVLHLVRDVEMTREMSIMSLNCIRWAPGAGHGFVYGTNTGQLKILR